MTEREKKEKQVRIAKATAVIADYELTLMDKEEEIQRILNQIDMQKKIKETLTEELQSS